MHGEILYVYYKVAASEHAATMPHVRRMQASLKAQWPGLLCELLQRPEASAGQETWMETYRHEDELSTEMVADIARAAVEAELPTPRHTESFIPLR
jgi:hypothetical protein